MTENIFYNELESTGRKIRERRHELVTELSNVDKEITDIEHYIEFYSLSASRGYKVSKMLKDCFQRRREIKDEIEMLNRISVMNVGHIANGKGRDDLEKIKHKQYTPRVLSELFTEGI